MLNRLEQFEEFKQSVARDDRLRLARDLHDGPLQLLTGIALLVRGVQRSLAHDPALAQHRLRELEDLIAVEHGHLRSFIQELTSAAGATSEEQQNVTKRLETLSDRLARWWQIGVEVQSENLEEALPPAFAREVYYVVQEALLNAARHANASFVRVNLHGQPDGLRIVVTDNGRGFPFHGFYDHATLVREGLGPVTLRERVAALGGTVAIDSGPSGSRLDVMLPLSPPVA